MKYLSLLVCFLTLMISSHTSAQDKKSDDDNLVPNGSFENLSDKLRRYGELELATGWENASEAPADVFSTTAHSHYATVPENYMGKEEPYEGNNYAGFVAYSFPSNRPKPRTYLSVRLKKPLEKRGLYCVTIYLSLSDLSHYATNGVGFVLSKGSISHKSGVITSPDAQTADLNPVIDKRDGWFALCKAVSAQGGEKYLTIGDFMSDDQLHKQTMDPVSGDTRPMETVAYYYVDNVEVRKIGDLSACNCTDNGGIPHSDLIYSSNTPIADSMTVDEKLDASTIYFHEYQPDLVSASKQKMDEVIKVMKANPLLKVDVVAHSDKKEVKLGEKNDEVRDLAEKRARAVQDYFVQNGIPGARLNLVIKDDKDPASPIDSDISRAKNRRVEFKVAH